MNNLSSNYLTLLFDYENEPGLFFSQTGERISFRNHTIRWAPAWGIQRRMFKYLYFDYKIGFGLATDSRSYPDRQDIGPVPDNVPFFDRTYGVLISEIRVGLAF